MRLLINGYYCDIANTKKNQKILFWNRRTLVHNRLMHDFFPEFPPIVFFSLYHIFKSKKKVKIVMVCVILFFFLNRCQFDSFLFRSFIHAMVWKIKKNKKKENSIFSQKKNWIRYIAMSMVVKKTGSFWNI